MICERKVSSILIVETFLVSKQIRYPKVNIYIINKVYIS
ncbi:hypothetical protein IEO_01590 [Bacillus wiedmannii]|nr:hypothetical protein IEO_01590 [Bacillus wiedmannii]